MGDCDTSILYPFARGIFTMFDMAVAFSCQIMAPFYASIVIVVDGCSHGGISDGIAKLSKVKNHIPKLIVRCDPMFVAGILASNKLREVRS